MDKPHGSSHMDQHRPPGPRLRMLSHFWGGGVVRSGNLPCTGLGIPGLRCLGLPSNRSGPQYDKVISFFFLLPKIFSFVLVEIEGVTCGHSVEMTSSQRTTPLRTWSPTISIVWCLAHAPLWDLALNPGLHTYCVNTPPPCCTTALFCCNVLFEDKVSIHCPVCPGSHSVMQADRLSNSSSPVLVSGAPGMVPGLGLSPYYSLFGDTPKTSKPLVFHSRPQGDFLSSCSRSEGYPSLL